MPKIVRPADGDRDAARNAFRQQVLERRLFQE
jgi:hypothetical protein